MKIYEARGKHVRITLDTGQVFEGLAELYTPAYDNTPEIASICIGEYELYENQIVSIDEI